MNHKSQPAAEVKWEITYQIPTKHRKKKLTVQRGTEVIDLADAKPKGNSATDNN